MRYTFCFVLLYVFQTLHAQNGVTVYNKDSVQVTFGAYVDAYFGYDFNRPADKDRPYAISSNRHDEIAINIAILKFEIHAPRVRLALSPAFGTLMEINYANEPPLYKNLYEAYAGFRPFKNRKIWVDAGIFVSPYTNENAISMDQITYTRSLGSEDAPYYLSGVRATVPVTPKVKTMLYVLNGWQVIKADHHLQSLGSNVEYKPTKKLSINWDLFGGDVRTDSFPNDRKRYYSDINVVWNNDGKFTATVCGGAGLQQLVDSLNKMNQHQWYSGAVQFRYRFHPAHAVGVKFDYFNDPDAVLVKSVLGKEGIVVSSAPLNYTWFVTDNCQFRMEARNLTGKSEIFYDRSQKATKASNVFICSLAVRF